MLKIETYTTKKELMTALPLSYLKQVFNCAKDMPREYKKCSCGKWFLSVLNAKICPKCRIEKINKTR